MRKILVKMDIHNAFKQCDEGEEDNLRNVNPRVDAFLVPLFNELTTKRPTWTYVCKGWGELGIGGTFYNYGRFTIMDGDEEIGEVWVGKNWRTGESKYAFNNPRLHAARSRGTCTETKDLKKAVKTILAHMYARTLSELMFTARSNAANKAGSAIYALQRDFNTSRSRLLPEMTSFIMNNWSAFEAYTALESTHRNTFRQHYENNARAHQFEAAMAKRDTATIVEHNGQFHAEFSNNVGTYSSWTLGEMPPHFKQAVGMLKLVDEGVLVDGIGLRTDNNTFYVLTGDNNE